MPWYGNVLVAIVGLLATIAMGYCGWVAHKLSKIMDLVSRHGERIQGLEVRATDRDRQCHERLDWIRTMEATVNKTATQVAQTKVIVESIQNILNRRLDP